METLYDLSGPGTYKITLTYEFDRNRKERGIKLGQDQTGDRLEKAFETQCTSEPLRVEVTAPKK